MKEATGEFSMTVVTIIAIVAIAGIIYALRDPITQFIGDTFMNSSKKEITEMNDKGVNYTQKVEN